MPSTLSFPLEEEKESWESLRRQHFTFNDRGKRREKNPLRWCPKWDLSLTPVSRGITAEKSNEIETSSWGFCYTRLAGEPCINECSLPVQCTLGRISRTQLPLKVVLVLSANASRRRRLRRSSQSNAHAPAMQCSGTVDSADIHSLFHDHNENLLVTKIGILSTRNVALLCTTEKKSHLNLPWYKSGLYSQHFSTANKSILS